MKKIINYKKKKSNVYEITLDSNEKINLYDDVILKYELLLKKEIDDNKLIEIIKDNNNLECYNKALKYIVLKLRNERELKEKLKDYNSEAIKYTITRLKKEGYLNDLLYIKSYINDAINLKIIGPVNILYNLKKEGFKEDDILNYLNTFDESIWLNKIDKIVSNKIKANHNNSGDILKQKIIQGLLQMGFYRTDIINVINNYEFNDDKNIYEKEYNKLKNKYQKKYSGKDLEYRIKNGMLRKGFKNIYD